jgi:NADPH:quinone reductase-like Zn-dependent oxidoreductase/NAD(P)-dependent dehydrogenase (short-subunit alcohol dehydrogenase family)/SAM-dependent methyltransferase/acyl carrier protein
VRVLEIGAGTGGTTRHVLPALPHDRVHYLYTDMSVLFLGEARDRFREFPFVEYRILDIGRDPADQGFALHQADLVIASNVLHATPDLADTVRHVRSLLAPGGLLVLVEGIAKQRWVDTIFGLTEGWWNSTDAELRAGYPLISQATWRRVLTEAGFTHAVTVPGDGRESELFQQAVIMARAADPATLMKHDARKWLLLADRGGFTERLADRLRQGGADCRVVRLPGVDTGRDEDDRIVDPESREDVRRLLEECAGSEALEIVSAWALDACPDVDASAGVLEEVEQRLVTASLNLVQAAARGERSRPPRLWWLSRGAQSVHADAKCSLAQVPILGLAKTITVEHPELRNHRVDLDPWPDLTEVNRVVAELLRPDDEDEVAYRRGERLVPRIERSAAEPPSTSWRRCDSPGANYRLTVDPVKGLQSLRYEAAMRIPPGPDEIEIDVRASGLNFKDVLGALGLYPGDPGPLGGEASGVVTAVGSRVTGFSVGDEVMAFCPGAFAAFVTMDARLAVAKPARLSFEQAAAIPGAFLTAYHAVVQVAQLQPGERILVHAGAGGVGMAAIAIARMIGAPVYATAGSPEKRAWLMSLGVLHVMDSRSAASLRELEPLTNGAGVDVVINSLSGDFVQRSLDLLAKGGRFVELGKRDLLDDGQIAALAPRLTYHTVDLGELARRDPGTIAPMLRQLHAEFLHGRLQPLPLRVFPIEETAAAFDFMARARHLGKICISQTAAKAHPARAIRDTIRADASYLITGGFGGLGIETAGWLVRQGARHVVLMGRGAATVAASSAIADLRAQGAQIRLVLGDVASEPDVRRVLDEIRRDLPALRGIVHSAGTLADAVVLQQDWDHFRHVFAAKVFGAWHLHRATAVLDLDFFVLYSSAAAVLGTAGQANHVAANAFLDSLAHWRRATGLPGISINWGAWGRIGAVADSELARRLSLRGLMTITPAEGVRLLETALDRNQAQIAAVALDWATYLKQFHTRPPRFFDLVTPAAPRATVAAAAPAKTADLKLRLTNLPSTRRKGELLRFVAAQIAAGLEIDNAAAIDPGQPLSELGVDSLLAVELRHRLSAALGVERSLPATLLFDYPTIEALAGYIADKVLNLNVAAMPAAAADAEEPDDRSLIADLSDAEAEAMLLRELDMDVNE